jgi:uncharacterized protein (TIRG00374 family)
VSRILETIKIFKIEDVLNSENKFKLLLKLIITLALVIYLVYFLDLRHLASLVKNGNQILVSIALLLVIVNILFQYIKWKRIALLLLDEKNNRTILTSLFYGFTAGVFTPARIGEYVGRGVIFKDKPMLDITFATLFDKGFTFIVLTGFGLLSFTAFLMKKEILTYPLLAELFLGVLVLISAIYIFFKYGFSQKLNGVVAKYDSKFNLISKILLIIREDKSNTIYLLMITILYYLTFLAQFSILLIAFNANILFIEGIWIGSIVFFIKTLIPSITIGEIGIRETISMLIVTHFGIASELGFNAAFLLFTLNIIIPALVGLFFVIRFKYD